MIILKYILILMGNVARVAEMKNSYSILVEKTEGMWW
jgi:hypothetical protein